MFLDYLPDSQQALSGAQASELFQHTPVILMRGSGPLHGTMLMCQDPGQRQPKALPNTGPPHHASHHLIIPHLPSQHLPQGHM